MQADDPDIKWVEEPNFFFRQSDFAPALLKLYEDDPDFLRPKARMNEIRNVVAGGLQDVSVSRSESPWGIPWPDDASHSVWVWFDAVTNYLSATGFPDEGFDEVWPADLHVIGPDITRFHAALWPAMLMAADLSARHGWLTRADVERTEAILAQAGLPTRPPASMSEQQFMDLMSVDKKVVDGGLRLVLLNAIGDAFVTADYQPTLLSQTLTAA